VKFVYFGQYFWKNRFGTLHVLATNLILSLQTLMTDTLEALGEIGEQRVHLGEEVNKSAMVIT